MPTGYGLCSAPSASVAAGNPRWALATGYGLPKVTSIVPTHQAA
jgi:hypothetical protein